MRLLVYEFGSFLIGVAFLILDAADDGALRFWDVGATLRVPALATAFGVVAIGTGLSFDAAGAMLAAAVTLARLIEAFSLTIGLFSSITAAADLAFCCFSTSFAATDSVGVRFNFSPAVL